MAIGQVGVSNIGEAAIQSPNAGAGISQAISNLAGALSESVGLGLDQKQAEQTLLLSHQQTADKFTRATLQMDFIKADAEFSRQLDELAPTLPPGAPGFTNQTSAMADKVYGGFLSTVPARMKPEFASMIENAKQGKINGSFTYEAKSRDAAFAGYVADLGLQAMNSINSQQTTYADWLPVINNFAKNSPLPPAQTKTLIDTVLTNIQSVAYGQDRQMFTEHPEMNAGTWGGPTDGSDIVAAGVPGEFRGFLNFTASGESPDYNTINGGGKFNSYADHPGKATPGHSSAAGRYQFIYSTWKEAQRALNLPDFSPESQDRAAMWLASRDYQKQTGRSLQLDLQSGDPATLNKVVSALSPTWASFVGRSGADLASYLKTSGTPDHLTNDPLYNLLNPEQKSAIDNAAVAQANAQMVANQKAATTQLNSLMDSIKTQAYSGNFTQAQTLIDQNYQNGNLPADKIPELNNYLTAEQARSDKNNFFGITMSGVSIYNPTDSTQRDNYQAFYDKSIAPTIHSQDEQGFIQNVLPVFQKTGAVPQGFAEQLQGMMVSSNAKTAIYALDVLDVMAAKSPGAFGMLPKDVQQQGVYYSLTHNSLPLDEILNNVRGTFDAGSANVRTYRQGQAQAFIMSATTAPNFSIEKIAKNLPGFDSQNTKINQPEEMQSAYFTLFQENIGKYPTPELALEATNKLFPTIYGISGITGTDTVMKRPPEKYYPPDPATGNYSYLGEQLKFDTQLGVDEHVLLSADQQTEADIAEGKPVSYSVAKLTPYGIMPVYLPGPANERQVAGRFVPDPAKAQRDALTANVARIQNERQTMPNKEQAVSTYEQFVAANKGNVATLNAADLTFKAWRRAVAANDPIEEQKKRAALTSMGINVSPIGN